MRRKMPLGRRAFLAGIGGTAVALPFLDVMRPHRASAGGINVPHRYMVWFSGNSTGQTHDIVVPEITGPGYELTGGLARLAEHGGIRSEISIVSGLVIPWEVGGVIPAGGRPRDFHDTMMSALLAGVRSDGSSVRGPTSDQIAADVLAGDVVAGETAFRSLELRVQASQYRDGREDYGISYRQDASGVLARNPPISSPRIAYDALFRTFGAIDAAEAERRQRLLDQDRSVIDLVEGDTERLMTQLGREDQIRLERHFDEIRALETRLSILTPTSGACALPADPGEDPAIAISRTGYGASDTNTAIMGWADEDLRARVMCDLVHMAYVCDLTRVASMMMTFPQSFMSVEPICGIASDLHEMSHGQGDDATWGQALAWLTGWFGYLAAKLRDTPEGDGSVLDRTGMIFLFEGGWGYDPADDAEGHAHSTENMSLLVAGRAGGLVPGTHLRAEGAHPAQAINTVLHAVGVTGDLGEVTGEIPGLRSA
jgi:hypothetical protein